MSERVELLGRSRKIIALREQVRALLSGEATTRRLPPLLITGETGTGKSLLARIIHEASSRAAAPFVELNGAAIPENLLESELFGYERGAFTDARQSKPGLFQVAHRGTLFLDEVGLLPLALQAKLLRVLEDGSVRRLGATRSEPVDVCVISATNEDLQAAVRARRFREDLYHRLAVITLPLPPLRDLGDDIDLLAAHALGRSCAKYSLPPKTLSPDARAAMQAYRWSGNVRELNSVIERAVLMCAASVIPAAALALEASPATGSREAPAPGESERERLAAALAQMGWNVSRTAALLGITRNTIRARIARYGLHPSGPGERLADSSPAEPADPTRPHTEIPPARAVDQAEMEPREIKANSAARADTDRQAVIDLSRGRVDRAGRQSSLGRVVSPFVGRRQELEQLAQWLNDALAGRPRVILIRGDAGIGKTRFLQEGRSIAQRLQIQVCFGRCSEDVALPYLPFIESLLPELEKLADPEQGPDPELEVIRRLLRRGEPLAAMPGLSMPGQADQDKLHLFLAVGHSAVRLAQRHPFLFVVDDLHWADRLSLDLFDHLALTVAEVATREAVPLVIVGTYRTTEPGDRLARLAARLEREQICRTFSLHGLTEPEIQELIGGLGLVRPSHQLTATVSEATQGNPLFVQEVLAHLVRQDALQEQGGYLVTTAAPADLRLPDQVTSAIVARTQTLSDGCQRVLTSAAFVGERFSVEVVAAVSGVAEDELLDRLEEAMRQRLLWSEGPAFQFAHPLIRHVFYNAPSAARRERIHREITESLQRLYAGHTDAHLLEIAHHLVRAGSAAPADVVIEYARRAADQAFRLFAWGEAAHYYEATLAASAAAGRLTAEDRASLHYSAGLAHYYDRDVGPCLHHYEKAIETYRQLGDLRGLAQSLMEKTRTLTITALPLGALGDLQPLEDVLAALGEGEPLLRGHIAAVMAEAYRNSRQAEKAQEKAKQALEIGQQLQDDDLCAYASFALSLAHINDLNVREALEVGRGACAYARRASDLIREGWALHRIPLYLTLLGRLDEAQEVAGEACELTSRSNDWWNHSLGLSHLASVAVVRGDFTAVEQHAHETMVMISRSQYPWGGLRSLLALACARAFRGAWAEAEDALDLLVEPGRVFKDAGPVVGTFARVIRQLLAARAGAAVGDLEPLAADLMRIVGSDSYSLAPLCALVELGDLAASPAIADLPGPALSRAVDRGVVFSSGWMFLVPRVLGNADAVNRRWGAAEARFQSALDVATHRGARPELGRSCLDYARMLMSRGARSDRPRAIELVNQAGAIFRDLGMAPFTREATGLAEKLWSTIPSAAEPRAKYPDNLAEREVQVLVRLAGGRSNQEIAGDLVLGPTTVAAHVRSIFDKIKVKDEATAAAYAAEKGLMPPGEVERAAGERRAPALRIILVSDVVASGALIHRAGDAKAHDLMRIHNEIIRNCLATHGGTEVTHTGDGLEASFDSATAAVECGIAVQHAFATHNADHPAAAMHVRIGINAGEPISTEGRLFGTAVHTAFGICARAGPDQILVSDVVGQLVAGKGFTLTSRGRVNLKGLPGRLELYEVSWARRPG